MIPSPPDKPRAVLGVLLGVLAAACAGCPVTQPQDTPVPEMKCRESGTGCEYYLYVPSDHAELGAMPMMVTLHGTHGFDSARAQVREWKALAEEHCFVVLSPKLKSPQGILPIIRPLRLAALAKDEKRVLAAMDEVMKRYKINDKAVMITGFSAGGFPLYYIAMRNPDRFSVLVARACNADMKIIESIPVTDKLRAMSILIFFSKTGIMPIYSKWNLIARQSWAAYQFFRYNDCKGASIKSISGGHHRRPERALRFWKGCHPKAFPRREQ